MQHTIFVVNEEPYCIWEVDLPARVNEFLDGIDTEYFDYVIRTHLEANDEKRASIALRTALHHAMETLFSLLGAYIQGPNCPHAWVAKCSNPALRDLVVKIGANQSTLFTRLSTDEVSWKNVASAVFRFFSSDSEKTRRTAGLFAVLWGRLGHEFTSREHIDEYNSIKHGFRIRSGGFGLAVGVEHEYGVAPPPDEMKMVGNSEFGTSFLRIEPIGKGKDNRSLRSRRVSLNWTIEKTALLLQLVSMSIKNVVSALRIANGASPGTCRFHRPTDDSDFDRPWSYSPGVLHCSFDFDIPEDQVRAVKRAELLQILAKAKDS